MIFTELEAKRILEIVDQGLTKGLGSPVPGELCVEAAVSLALGLPPGDNPHCVGKEVRKFKIALNDCDWESNASRAKGMRKLAVAQVGSNTIDQRKFAKIVALETAKQLIPRLFDHLGIKGVEGCHEVKTLKEAQKAAKAAVDVALALAATATDKVTTADAAEAADAGCYAAYAAADTAAEYAADAANYARRATRSDEFLLLSAQIGLDALIQLKSPGCKFLYLCN